MKQRVADEARGDARRNDARQRALFMLPKYSTRKMYRIRKIAVGNESTISSIPIVARNQLPIIMRT